MTETLPKKWWESKTILLQIVGALASLGIFFSDMTPEQMGGVVLLIQLGVNSLTMIVRRFTSRPIEPVTKSK